MTTQTITVPLPCEALIDQGRFVGNDPVGHRCHNNAAAAWPANGQVYRVCDDCRRMLVDGSPRVTLPPLAVTDEQIAAIVRQVTDDIALDRQLHGMTRAVEKEMRKHLPEHVVRHVLDS